MTLATNSRGHLKSGLRNATRGISTLYGNRRKGSTKRDRWTAPAKKKTTAKKIIEAEVTAVSHTNFYRGFLAQGIYVETWETLPVGTRLRVRIDIENLGQKLEVEGQVRLIKTEEGLDDDLNSGMGIEFLWLTHTQQKTIEQFCMTREPIFYEY